MDRADSGAISGVSRPTFGSQFGKIVPKRRQTVLVGGYLQSGQNVGIKLSGRKGASRGDVSESVPGHASEPVVVDFPVSSRECVYHWEDCRLCQLTQLTSVDKGLQDVLLDSEIVVADASQLISQWG